MSADIDHSPCVVIGAGAAGVSAAKWLHSFEVDFRWFGTRGDIGGLLHRVNNTISNYPGGHYRSGEALIEALRQDVAEFSGPALEDGHVRTLRRQDERWRIAFADHAPMTADAVILATGTSYRTLDVPGEAEAMGDCVSQSATADAERFAGRRCAVVGGGDAGFENALLLAEAGCEVHMLLRSRHFKARPRFVERAAEHPNIIFSSFPTVVKEINPLEGDEGCRLYLDVAGRHAHFTVACLFVRIGVDPVVPDIHPAVDSDHGFLIVDAHQRTSADGLFAAGDVTHCLLRSVATAVGTGATAAKAAAIQIGAL